MLCHARLQDVLKIFNIKMSWTLVSYSSHKHKHARTHLEPCFFHPLAYRHKHTQLLFDIKVSTSMKPVSILLLEIKILWVTGCVCGHVDTCGTCRHTWLARPLSPTALDLFTVYQAKVLMPHLQRTQMHNDYDLLSTQGAVVHSCYNCMFDHVWYMLIMRIYNWYKIYNYGIF